jgi:hypothetical protein
MGEILDLGKIREIRREKEQKKTDQEKYGWSPTIYERLDELSREYFMKMAHKHFVVIDNGSLAIDDDKLQAEKNRVHEWPDDEVIAFIHDSEKVDTLVDKPYLTMALYDRLHED